MEETIIKPKPKIIEHKYHKIKRLGDDENKDLLLYPEDEIVIEEKMDGCFNYNTKIDTDKGQFPIGEIVNKKLRVNIKTIDEDGNVVYKPILNYFHNGKGDNWRKLYYEENGRLRYLVVTGNHKIKTNSERGYTLVDDLKVGQDVYLGNPTLTDTQRSILIGSILGDCSFRNMNHKTKNPIYSETHGIKQKDYLLTKKHILRNLVTYQEEYEGAFNSNYKKTKKIRIHSISSTCFKELSFMYKNGKKDVMNIENKLDYLSLAIWYCDDGSISISDKQKPRLTFHCQSFSKKGCEELVKELDRLGLIGSIHNYKGGNVITLGFESTNSFFDYCTKHIPKCMDYKVPLSFRTRNRLIDAEELFAVNNLSPTKVIRVEEYKPINKQKYDLEVEGTHTYFAKNIYVSNSNFRFIVKDGVLYFGTHTNDITSESEKDWLRCMNYIRSNIKLEHAKEGLIYYGECMRKHTLSYDWENTPPFLGFDIMETSTEKYLDEPWKAYEILGLPFVPILKRIIASQIELPITDDCVPVSDYSLMQAEGIVLKNYKRQIFAKYVRQEFKEKNAEVFGKNKKRATNDNDYFVSAYYTNARIQKQVFKLIDEGEKLSVELMHSLPRRVYLDIWEEEWPELAKSKKTYNFADIQKTGTKRVFKVLQNIIQNNSLNTREE